MSLAYAEFLDSKRLTHHATGKNVGADAIHSVLFPFQRDLTRWALRKGRAAIFADTGLGKTYMQLEWARLTEERTLIIAPLTVARQTVRLAQDVGVTVHYTRASCDVQDGINITNYEMLHEFEPSAFGAVVLDESSILKGLDGKTRQRLTDMFSETPYRLCCTATPAPNDITEIANHAEFLGIMTRAEMLATFFVHDDEGWRLKGHAREPFYRWLASWGMSIRMPSDLGYDDDGYVLPELSILPHWVTNGYVPSDQLFFTGLKGIGDRIKVRRETMEGRTKAAAELVNADSEQWIVWCGMNDEAERMAELIPGSVNVQGSDDAEEKARRIEAFQDGAYRVLVTKPKIAGFGMNFQNAHNQVFVGLSDSWEAYYQCIRRSWRFGQTHPVRAHIVLSDAEQAVYENVMRKEAEAREMSAQLIANVAEMERDELGNQQDEWQYDTATIEKPEYKIMLGDSAERLAEVADESIDLSLFSPPFLSIYTYSPTSRDVGNSKGEDMFYEHFGFISDHLMRVTKPGRNVCVHVAQVPAQLAKDGYIGLKDFRGGVIRHFEARGFIYHGEVCIDRDPQAQAIRTHSKALLFAQLRKDASWLRPALSDYILVFRKPGENTVPVKPEITNNEWIEWARPIWYGIRESDTLNVAEGRDDKDERHIAPLQLGTIESCIRLWSNRGETVLTPFMGIGSETYMAVKLGRRTIGIELKPSYFKAAAKNMERATAQSARLL